MSVISSVTHVIQPFMFSTLYGATVATNPRAIFSLRAVLVIVCVILLNFLKDVVSGEEREIEIPLSEEEATI